MRSEEQNDVISPFRSNHDHKESIVDALKVAEEQCISRGLKLTKTRKQVLSIVWQQHNPVGAYDVLQELELQGHKPAPPTAYRALEFLVNANLIHRIESLNAYVGCPSPQHDHQCQFYICNECGHIAEVFNKQLSNILTQTAKQIGFKSDQSIIEVHGTCGDCQNKS